VRYHTLGPNLRASSLTQHKAGLGERAVTAVCDGNTAAHYYRTAQYIFISVSMASDCRPRVQAETTCFNHTQCGNIMFITTSVTFLALNIFGVEDGVTMFNRNDGIYLKVHTALQPRRSAMTIGRLFMKFGLSNTPLEQVFNFVSSTTETWWPCEFWGGNVTNVT
jgi:hypothetical protein